MRPERRIRLLEAKQGDLSRREARQGGRLLGAHRTDEYAARTTVGFWESPHHQPLRLLDTDNVIV